MGRLPTADTAIVEELTRELTTIYLDGSERLHALMPRLREFLELDSLVLFCPVPRLRGWGVERLEVDNLPDAPRFAGALTAFLARAPRQFWCFDPLAPEKDQRDCVIETIAHVGETAYRASPIYRDLLRPLRLDTGSELRALVCDGPRLLAWIGGFQEAPIKPSQHDRFAALLPAFRRRLAADRALTHQKLASAALSTLLDQLPDAAYILGPQGEIESTNSAARKLDPEKAIAALTGNQSERVRLPGTGHTLVILHPVAAPQESRVVRAAEAWGLTARQQEVLQLVIRGCGNVQIAEELSIGERAVELQVAAILARAGVGSRSALIAVVLAT